MAGLVVVLVSIVMLAMASAMGAVAVAKAQARTAADGAALAAAMRLHDGGDARQSCGVASAVAQRNAAAVQECSIDGGDATVAVRVDVGHLQVVRATLPGLRVQATARAGPVECGAGAG